MKRFRIYEQDAGHLIKVRHYKELVKICCLKKCGYDDFNDALVDVKVLWSLRADKQFCIIDYISGQIVALNMKMVDSDGNKYTIRERVYE